MVPFLKWAGGKRWLFNQPFLESMPPFERYIEPFLGGGAGFFALKPKHALLSDINADLIELYCTMRDSPSLLKSEMELHQKLHSKEYYYFVRDCIFDNQISRAARTLYLNRTCWNGLYRLNKQGNFNVPIGTKSTVISFSDDFEAVSQVLKTATIVACDFEISIKSAEKGDLVFVDPPYTVKHNMNGFVKYNENIFGWLDQIRLKKCLTEAVDRGVSVIITNANHSSVRELYENFGNHIEVNRHSVISGKIAGRSSVSELVVRA